MRQVESSVVHILCILKIHDQNDATYSSYHHHEPKQYIILIYFFKKIYHVSSHASYFFRKKEESNHHGEESKNEVEYIHFYCVRKFRSSSTCFLVSLSASSWLWDDSIVIFSSTATDSVISSWTDDKLWYCVYSTYHIPSTIHTKITRKNLHGVSSAAGIRISQRSFSDNFFFPLICGKFWKGELFFLCDIPSFSIHAIVTRKVTPKRSA